MLGGGGTLGVGITMFLRDQFSAPAARVRTSAQQTTAQLRQMQQDQLRQQRNMYAGLAVAGALAIRGMGKVVKSAAKFGYEMEFVKQISKSTIAEQAKLSEQAMALGQRTIFFAKDVAEGMRFMAMAGMGYKEVTGNIASAVDLAAAANLSIAGRGGAADILTNIMKSFKKEASESAYIADILAEAATSANTNVFELGEALKYAGSTAMDLSISLEEATAMAMTLANAGIQGSMAGVAMENSMRYLARAIGPFASGRMVKALDMVGLSAEDFQDAAGNILPMVQNIGLLRDALVSTGNINKQGVLTALFGVRGKRAGSLLMRNYEEFQQHLTIFQNAQGRAGEISRGMMDTLEGSLRRLKAVWQHLGIFFTEGLIPVLRPVLRILEWIVQGLQQVFKIPILGNFVSSALAGFIVLKTATFAYRAVVAGIRLVTMQAGMATTTMQARAVAGYNAMTGAATRYNVAARAGMITNIGGLATGASAGLIGRNAAGRLIRTGGGIGKTGRFVGKKAAGRYLGMYGTRLAAGAAAGATGGRMLIPILGRMVGILGGPLGLALSFILPGAIGALVSVLKKNKEATGKQTDETRKNKEALISGRIGAIEHLYADRSRLMTARDILNMKVLSPEDITPGGFRTMVQRCGVQPSVIEPYVELRPDIHIYMDGTEITDSALEKVEAATRRAYHNAGMN